MSEIRICPVHVISLALMGALIGILSLHVAGHVSASYARSMSEVLLIGLGLSGCQLFLNASRN